eukprot:Skav206084  [mRNA]  locus=scaffold2150:70306:73151:+ [translate_table: standard]
MSRHEDSSVALTRHRPIVILLAFQLLSAAIFIWVEPEWDLQKALWYVMVTATTVGYGDVSVSTSNEWGLVWASLHILLLAALIEDVTALKEERKELPLGDQQSCDHPIWLRFSMVS